MRFENPNSTLNNFTLSTLWRIPPQQVIHNDDEERRAQRRYKVDFEIKGSEVPKIIALSLGYIGGGVTNVPMLNNEISFPLFEKRSTLLFGAGYDNTKQPMILAKPTVLGHQPYIAVEGNAPSQN
jgi:hypothetical protein